MNEYRVSLEIYNGPLDLLLYLIRREEVDIYDIPIARITQQYIGYVDVLRQIDPNLAGEFLVLAATLMEIKTRMLLPTPPPEEGRAGVAIDPRAELVRQLLEYKAFKDAAGDLSSAAELQGLKFPRRPNLPGLAEGEIDLEDVQVWDLLDAFSKLMAATGQVLGQQEVIYDDTPVELYAADILDRLQREGPLTFREIFEGRTLRTEVIGLFLALLELVRQKMIFAAQEGNFGDIHIHVNPNPPHANGEEPAGAASDAERQADAPVLVPSAAASGPPQGARDAQPQVFPESSGSPLEPACLPPACLPQVGRQVGRVSQVPAESGTYVSETTGAVGRSPSDLNPEEDDDGGTATAEPGS